MAIQSQLHPSVGSSTDVCEAETGMLCSRKQHCHTLLEHYPSTCTDFAVDDYAFALVLDECSEMRTDAFWTATVEISRKQAAIVNDFTLQLFNLLDLHMDIQHFCTGTTSTLIPMLWTAALTLLTH